MEGGHCPDTRRSEMLQEKEKHNLKHWRKLSDVMHTMVPHSLFLFEGGWGEKEGFAEDLFKPVSVSMVCMPVLGLAALTHLWPQKTKAIVPLLGGFDTA